MAADPMLRELEAECEHERAQAEVQMVRAERAEDALSALIEATAGPTGRIRLYGHQHAEAGSGEDWQRIAEWSDEIRDGLKAARKAMGWDIESLTDEEKRGS